MRMVTSEPSSFGGSAKMTPSPPTPKLRSHARAACSGVSDGALPRRSSTCTEMAHAASAGHARGHTRVARGANSRLLPFCCPEPCHTPHTPASQAAAAARAAAAAGLGREGRSLPAHTSRQVRALPTRAHAPHAARAGGRAGGRAGAPAQSRCPGRGTCGRRATRRRSAGRSAAATRGRTPEGGRGTTWRRGSRGEAARNHTTDQVMTPLVGNPSGSFFSIIVPHLVAR